MTSRAVAVAGVAVALVLAAVVAVRPAVRTDLPAGSAADAPAGAAARSTATVVRTDLASTVQLTGALGFGDAVAMPLQGPGGTLTARPAPGTVVRQGQPLFEIDGVPVVLLYGRRPAWRDLAPGVPRGADVLQLERDLVALGNADPHVMRVDGAFTWATSRAVRRWQRASHLPVTGTLPLGRVVFARGVVRVAALHQPLGATLRPGQLVLSVTPATPVVTLDVPVAQTRLVHQGDRVAITMPSGLSRNGVVASISPVVTDGGTGRQDNPLGGGLRQPQVTATVALTRRSRRADPGLGANIDQAPVTVTVTDRRVRGVLAVPVTALVALAGGGFGLWVDSPGPRHVVRVTTGLFAASLVQVTGTGLAAGDEVEVPAA